MTDKLDTLIREALEGEDRAIYEQTGELGYFAQAFGLFSGKWGWVSWVIMIVQLVLFLAGAWAAWRFFQTDDALGALKWGLPAATLLLMAAQMKLSLMPALQADRIIREIKRLELLLARKGD